jgi:hypothetical protein
MLLLEKAIFIFCTEPDYVHLESKYVALLTWYDDTIIGDCFINK